MRALSPLLGIVLLVLGCPEAPVPVEPSAPPPAEVLEGLAPDPDVPPIDPEIAENLVRLTGQLGGLDFPSTTDVIERCRAGDAVACASLGTRLAAGTWGLERDEASAVPLFRYACDAGEMDGCHSLALALRYGRGVDADVPRSVELFQRACDGESVVACSFLADAYRYGRGVDPEPERSLAILERTCLLGAFCRDVARDRLAVLSSRPGAPYTDTPEAAEADCLAGDATACWWQALALATGSDEDAQYARVEGLLVGACEAGLADACGSLAFHLLIRHTSPGYRGKAHDAFRRACDGGVGCDHLAACPDGDSARVKALAGDAHAAEGECGAGQMDRCLHLGIAFTTGNGVTRDCARAAGLFERVCESGDPHGCWYLGGAYARGEGIAQDAARAAALFRRGCDVDHPNSCVDLAFAHVYGRGVPQDLPAAVALFDKACTLGTACDHADHYRERLAPRPQ
jgi:uncharacterized protein